MSKKYKFFKDEGYPYFVTFTVTDWIDLFTREEYNMILLDSIIYFQKEKELIVYAWVIMTNHVHMIVGTKGKTLSDIMRDLKRFTSEMLHKAIKRNPQESRREWILTLMENTGQKSGKKFQLWQPESHPIMLDNHSKLFQRLNYVHNNPVKAGFVTENDAWKYSSAIDYCGGSGLLEIDYLGSEVVFV